MENENNKLQVWNSDEFGEIRTLVEPDGRILFCAIDIAKALQYAKPNNAISAHCWCSLRRGVPHPQSKNATIEMIFIPQSDLNRLVAKSEDFSQSAEIREKAARFNNWIYDTVLPSIQKYGAYLTPEKADEIISNPDTIIALAMQVKQERAEKMRIAAENERIEAERKALAEKNTVMQPKAEYYDHFISADALTNFRDTAGQLGIAERVFMQLLLSDEFIYVSSTVYDKASKRTRNFYRPYANKNFGYFKVKDFRAPNGFYEKQVLVTPQGKEFFRHRYANLIPDLKEIKE